MIDIISRVWSKHTKHLFHKLEQFDYQPNQYEWLFVCIIIFNFSLLIETINLYSENAVKYRNFACGSFSRPRIFLVNHFWRALEKDLKCFHFNFPMRIKILFYSAMPEFCESIVSVQQRMLNILFPKINIFNSWMIRQSHCTMTSIFRTILFYVMWLNNQLMLTSTRAKIKPAPIVPIPAIRNGIDTCIVVFHHSSCAIGVRVTFDGFRSKSFPSKSAPLWSPPGPPLPPLGSSDDAMDVAVIELNEPCDDGGKGENFSFSLSVKNDWYNQKQIHTIH